MNQLKNYNKNIAEKEPLAIIPIIILIILHIIDLWGICYI